MLSVRAAIRMAKLLYLQPTEEIFAEKLRALAERALATYMTLFISMKSGTAFQIRVSLYNRCQPNAS